MSTLHEIAVVLSLFCYSASGCDGGYNRRDPCAPITDYPTFFSAKTPLSQACKDPGSAAWDENLDAWIPETDSEERFKPDENGAKAIYLTTAWCSDKHTAYGCSYGKAGKLRVGCTEVEWIMVGEKGSTYKFHGRCTNHIDPDDNTRANYHKLVCGTGTSTNGYLQYKVMVPLDFTVSKMKVKNNRSLLAFKDIHHYQKCIFGTKITNRVQSSVDKLGKTEISLGKNRTNSIIQIER